MAAHFGDILLSIRQRLADKQVVPKERVLFWARRGEPPHLVGDQDIILRVKGIVSPQDIVQGAGRLSRVYRNVEITCRARSARDRLDTDEIFLLDAEKGLLALEEKVYDALEMFHPQTLDGQDVLTGEPIRFLTSADPDRLIQKQGASQGWGSAAQIYQTMYEPLIDQTWQ